MNSIPPASGGLSNFSGRCMLTLGVEVMGFWHRLTHLNSVPDRLRYDEPPLGHLSLARSCAAARLRATDNEVCDSNSRHEIGARTCLASKILKAATRGDTSSDGFMRLGREVPSCSPTMW